MSVVVSLTKIQGDMVEQYRQGNYVEADKIAGLIINHYQNNFIANKILGLCGMISKNYSPALTFLRNAARVDPADKDVMEGISECIKGMQADKEASNIYVIGDSHTQVFRKIHPMIVRWIGPVSMHRIARDGVDFMDYRFYGVQENSTVICVFGEIDARAHVLKNKNEITENIDNLISGYLRNLKAAATAANISRQIVSSMMPPGRNLPSYLPVIGDIEERISTSKMINEILRFGCKIL